MLNPERTTSEPAPLWYRQVCALAFLLIILFSVGLKIYKANHAGIIYDERANYQLFSSSIHRALNVFNTTNNHVLNSVFMYYAHKYFGYYEHFIRIPSLSAGILFSLSIAYIVYKTIQSRILRVTTLAVVSFVPIVFNYSFLARGYSFALAGIFTEIAFLLWLLDHKIKFRYWPIPVVVISLMNFLAFGAMLSSILLLAALNMTFILLYSFKVFSNRPRKLITVIVNLVSISLLSFVLLFALYRHIYKDILDNPVLKEISGRMRGWPGFTGYLHNILISKVFRLNSPFATVVFCAFICLIATAIAFHLHRFSKAMKERRWRNYLNAAEPGPFLFIISGLTIIFMFVQCVIMKKGLGLARSHVFLIPLVWICFIMVLDRCILHIGRGRLKIGVQLIVATILGIVALRNMPDSHRISSSTISGPVLRKLKAIDPDKTWHLAFTEKMEGHLVGFFYYKQFDYKFKILKRPESEVLICDKDEWPKHAICRYKVEILGEKGIRIHTKGVQPKHAACLDWDYFSKSNCAVVLNCSVPQDKVVVQFRLIED
ncbi:MAG TPA: hypothetical protein HPP87_06875 [Planctomycetes bacterium]|nr:hypothetical protein [Planctomycetota bacterium]HIJ71069.1 hypothetical protein [Planctomycetota bacterium]